MARELDFRLRLLDTLPRRSGAHTLLTSMPDVPSKTWSTISIRSREMRLHDVPERQRGFLSIISPTPLHGVSRPTSSFQNLARALGAIGQRQRHNLVVPRELDLSST